MAKVPARRRRSSIYRCYDLADWDQVKEFATWFSGREWFFRGQRDSTWRLRTSLERAAAACGRPPRMLAADEAKIILQFRRLAHLHGIDVPERDSADDTAALEWLALVQHHGGPTRLLDFTRSFWVAVFFAIELAAVDKWPGRQAVWAVGRRALWLKAMAQLPDVVVRRQNSVRQREMARVECCKRIKISPKWRLTGGLPELETPLALPVEPERMNARMAAQQGCFIFPLLGKWSFQKNLFTTFGIPRPDPGDPGKKYPGLDKLPAKGGAVAVVKVLLPDTPREGRAILRDMNITPAMLFPGLEGVARATFLEMP